jgi:hypothetical protein
MGRPTSISSSKCVALAESHGYQRAGSHCSLDRCGGRQYRLTTRMLEEERVVAFFVMAPAESGA